MISTELKVANSGNRNTFLVNNYKYCPPSALSNAIPRPRLVDEIAITQEFSAVVIQGPAGYGKSTLMQQVYDRCTKTGITTRWLTLDESDDDISRFSTLLNTLIQELAEVQADYSYAAFSESSGSSAVEGLLRKLGATSEPIALFVDEFQTIRDAINISLINTLIERCPHNVTFYIGSRALPDLARGKLLISGRLKLVGSEELCFNGKEVLEFIQSVGLAISDREAEAFREQTGGWPAVLQLLQLALRGGKVDRDTLLLWIKGYENELADYLADNVMREQPPERIQFLLKTSLLPRLSAPLCEAITGEKNAQEILEDFVSQGLFIRVIDSQQKWFKYHSLFSDYLHTQFCKEYADQEAAIYLQAAKWFQGENHLEEAIQQAVNAGLYTFAADILTEYAPVLICKARLQRVHQLCSLLPNEVVMDQPMLCWSLAWAHLFSSSPLEARQPLEGLQKLVEHNSEYANLNSSAEILGATFAYVNEQIDEFSERIPRIELKTSETDQSRNFEMSALANLAAIYHLRQGSYTIAREQAILALSLAERGEAAFSGAYALAFVSIALIESGELNLAIKKLKDGLNNDDLRIQGSFSTAPLSATYGYALYEAGHFVEAESHLRDTIDTISMTLPTDFLIAAYIRLARVSEFNDGENSDSLEILDRVEKLGFDRQNQRLVAAIRREHLRRALIKGNLKQARLLAERTEIGSAIGQSPQYYHITEGSDDNTISRIRLCAHDGKHSAALDQLSTELKEADEYGCTRRKIKLLILASMAHLADGNSPVAHAQMLSALELAAPQSYAATFIEEGPACISLVEETNKQLSPGQKHKLHKLIALVLPDDGTDSTTDNTSGTTNRVIEKPTKRELEILGLLAGGSSNTEIGDQLFVSTNTVKYHLKNLFGKLGVDNRGKLIAAARQLGFV